MTIINQLLFRFRRIYIVIFIISLILKFSVCLYLYDDKKIYEGDSPEYIFFGEQFSKMNFFPIYAVENHALEIGPVVPIILAIFCFFNSSPIIPFIIFNCIITSVIPLILHYCCSLFTSKFVSITILFWSLFYTDYFRFNHLVNKEPLVYFIFSLIFLYIVRIVVFTKSINIIIFSILVFLLTHVDPRYFFFIPLFIIPVLYVSYKKRMFYYPLYFLIIILTLNLPMLYYNYIVHKELIFVTPQTISITRHIIPSNIDKYNRSFTERHIYDSLPKGIDNNYSIALDVYYTKRYENAMQFVSSDDDLPYKYDNAEKMYKSFIHYWQPLFINYSFINDGFRPQKWSFLHNCSSFLFYGITLPFYILSLIYIYKKKSFLHTYIFIFPIVHSFAHSFVTLPLERYRSHINFLIVIISLIFMFSLLKSLSVPIIRNR